MIHTYDEEEHRNLQEQVEWNKDEIIKLKEIIDRLNLPYIEIDDTELVGQGELTDEQVTKLKNNALVYVLFTRDSGENEVHLLFDGEKYQEQDIIIKSMSAGGYARVVSFNLEEKVWRYYESDEDVEALIQRITDLENNKENKALYIEISDTSGTLTEEQLAILTSNKRNFVIYQGVIILRQLYSDDEGLVYSNNDTVNTYGLSIEISNRSFTLNYVRLASKSEVDAKQDLIQYIEINDDSGTLTDEQIQVLLASELNYIWYNGMHRLTFRYRDDNYHLSTYASNDQRQFHSIEIDTTTKRYHAYNGYCEGFLSEGDNVDIDRSNANNPIISVNSTSIITTAPTGAYTGGGIKFVHLASSTGVTEYNGYIYMYDED